MINVLIKFFVLNCVVSIKYDIFLLFVMFGLKFKVINFGMLENNFCLRVMCIGVFLFLDLMLIVVFFVNRIFIIVLFIK